MSVPEQIQLDDPRLEAKLDQLDLEQKVRLLTGRDYWSLWPIDTIGLRSMVVSDGPSGVRGAVWDERDPSLNLPSATALSSSWDPEIAYRYGAVAAAEARRKGVDVVLGPTINLHRSPLGGRHFEAFSEDPMLTAELAAAYVRGLQDNGVAANPKHYVANDFETDRFTVDVIVSERALRELYLLAFEKAVVEAEAWSVMSAYNRVNGTTMSEHELLSTPLKTDWGFDGVVISDWTAVRSLSSARAAQDLVMPGPGGPWGDALVEAVRSGEIHEAVIDDKVRRLLLLAARVGALADFDPPAPPAPVEGLAFTREAAIEGTVLVANDDQLLPLDVDAVGSIAVIGHNAVQARTQGGGSATVVPESVVSPLEGIRAAFPQAEVSYARGAVVQQGLAELARDSITNPVTGGPGARVRLLDGYGAEIWGEDRFATALVYFGGDAPIAEMSVLEFSTRWTPHETGAVGIGCAAIGKSRIYLNGELSAELEAEPAGEDLAAAFLDPPAMTVPVQVTAGEPVELRIELEPQRIGRLGNAMSVTIGTEPAEIDADELIAEAARSAAEAEVAVVVVGTNSKVESEGYDRTSLALPGRQDDLVWAVVAANPRTVVVVNSGSPVELPWRNEVPSILFTYFGGQEYGNALGRVLTGANEPGGRLPTTWPAREADVPVLDVTPVDGIVRYDEGIHIGYRAWLRSGIEPAYPFGHGLGYTTWSLAPAEVTQDGDTITVTVAITNTGSRAGKQVIQVYAERVEDSAVERPARWLVGFSPVRAEPGVMVEATIVLARRAFAHWDNGWTVEPGAYQLLVGTSIVAVTHPIPLRF